MTVPHEWWWPLAGFLGSGVFTLVWVYLMKRLKGIR